MEGLGGCKRVLAMTSFMAAARMLYESALLAERVSGLRSFLDQHKVRLRGVQNRGFCLSGDTSRRSGKISKPAQRNQSNLAYKVRRPAGNQT